MTTSGTYTYNPNVTTIINRALRQCGAITQGETPPAADVQDALDAQNAMVKAWQAEGIHVWTETDATVFLQPNQNTYLIGTGSTDAVTASWSQTTLTASASAGGTSLTVASITGISSGMFIGVQTNAGTNFWTTVSGSPSGSTVTLSSGLSVAVTSGALVFFYATALIRPLRVPGARRYLLSSATENPLIVMSRLDYANMPNKTNAGTVTQMFYDPQMTLGVMHIWPAPADNTAAVKFTAQMPLQDVGTLSNTLNFPQEWMAALAWNLAVELAPEYDVPLERFQMLQLQAAKHKAIVSAWDKEPESLLFGVSFAPGYR